MSRCLEEGEKGDSREKGLSHQHLVPKLMRGTSWPTSQEGIHLHRIPHLHSIPANVYADGSLTPPPTLAEGLGGGGRGRGKLQDLGLQEVKASLE